jgi:hypothetical protein
MSHTSIAVDASSAGGGDGRRFASGLIELMNALLGLIEQETEFVRAGRLSEAGALNEAKSELAGRYLAETRRLKGNAAAWFRGDPEALVELQRRQDLFRALLQVNLTVLATAHAVAEGLIRGAAGELARQNMPQGYGARGYAVAPPARAAQPVALSKVF